MTPDEIFKYCLENFHDVQLNRNWGENGIFYNPQNTRKLGTYVLTVKEKDGENDNSSNLNRDNIFRVNIGLRKETFIRMFGFILKRPLAGNIVDMNYDFSQVNTIMPHPVYAWMGWVCILNPSKETFQELESLIIESYNYAVYKFRKRKK